MSESIKTGIFWGVAVAVLAVAAFIAWPVDSRSERTSVVGQALFEEFKDPLVASSLKIVSFDEEQGQLETFEVRKDRESGVWTIPSRSGYPADALEQMRDAANSLVSLKILDIQTENAEDHDDLGVVEPKLEELEVGDEGVGRLVTFKDETQETLAALIIGKEIEGEEGRVYVRKPGQDPVYVVELDKAALTSEFQSWIEEDLLQLSSIDIEQMEIKDYNAALNLGMQVSLTRNYTATVSMDGSQWKLDKLLEFDPEQPAAPPKTVEVDADAKLNATKLNDMKNALDELKIVDVVRKPTGMSENLRADKDLISDEEAVRSLASRGFFPVPSGPQGEVEVLSANGELVVGLKDGVEYVLRFGNVAGLSEQDTDADPAAEDASSIGGVNRYLLVTTRVDESHFPPPDLQPVPQTLEELEAMEAEAAAKAAEDAAPPSDAEPAEGTEPAETAETAETAEPAETTEPGEPAEPAEGTESPAEAAGDETPAVEEVPAEKMTEQPAAEDAPEPASESDQPAEEPAGSESEPAAESEPETPESPEGPAEEPSEDESAAATGNGIVLVRAFQDEADPAPAAEAPESTPAQENAGDEDTASVEEVPSAETDSPEKTAEPEANEGASELSDEEKQERLEAEQEKITKENQRKIDERKDKIEAAQRRVRELNARFADWYYVIPENTYSQLRISRDQLFATDAQQAEGNDAAPPNLPQFNFPGQP